MMMLPKLPDAVTEFKIVPVSEKKIFINANNGKWIVTNPVGTELLNLCYNNHSVDNAARVIGVNPDDIRKFISMLKEHGMLEDELYKADPRQYDTLYNLQILVTNACNLNCIHCYADAKNSQLGELTFDEIAKVFDNAKRLEVEKLEVSGGEALIREDIVPILEKGREVCPSLSLSTNGTLFTEQICSLLSQLDCHVRISIDGATEEVHDAIRGEGSFRKVLNAINLIHKYNLGHTVNSCVNGINHKQIAQMAEFCSNHGLKRVHFIFPQYVGRARINKEKLYVSNANLYRVWRDVCACAEKYRDIDFIDLSYLWHLARRGGRTFCGMGRDRIMVQADGRVTACPYLELSVGNVRNESLSDIWLKSPELLDLRRRSVMEIERCKDCELRFICGGGCRADAPSMLAPQSFCYRNLYVEMFKVMLKREEEFLSNLNTAQDGFYDYDNSHTVLID